MAVLNDSIIPPFNFPEDFTEDASYKAAAASGNVVEFFFRWILSQHNAQVTAEQQIKPGVITVSDQNNYITRSSEAVSYTHLSSITSLLTHRWRREKRKRTVLPRYIPHWSISAFPSSTTIISVTRKQG